VVQFAPGGLNYPRALESRLAERKLRQVTALRRLNGEHARLTAASRGQWPRGDPIRQVVRDRVHTRAGARRKPAFQSERPWPRWRGGDLKMRRPAKKHSARARQGRSLIEFADHS